MNTKRILVLAALTLSASWATARAEDHRQYADAKPEECTECHQGNAVMENHGAEFLKEHKRLAQKTGNNCEQCHQQAWCSDCHHGGNLQHRMTSSLSRRGEAMPETHRADFVSTHAMKAQDDPASCTRCHQTQKFCSDCHAKQLDRDRAGMSIKKHAPNSVANPDPAWIAFHKADAKRNLQSCQTCHPRKSDCSIADCHPGLGGR